MSNDNEAKLLVETFPDGALGTIFAPVKAALANFGKTVSASAKLIGNDIGTFMKITFHWKTRSLSAQKQIMDNWKTNRTKHISEIITNSDAALDALGPDKYVAMMMCPSLFWTSKAYRGTTGLLSEDTRALIGEFGASNLPIIGGLFDGQRNPYGTGLFDRLFRSDAPPGSPEAQQEMSLALQNYLQDSGVPRDLLVDDPSTKQSAIKNILYKINDIFLFNILDHNEVSGNLLKEGEENDSMSIQEMGEKALAEIVAKAYKKSFIKERQSYLDEHRKVFEVVIAAVEQVLELNITLATTDDPDEFFKRLKSSVNKNKDLSEIDTDKLIAEFDTMTSKLSNDADVVTKLREELTQQKLIEPIEGENQDPTVILPKEKSVFERNIKKIALDNCKGSFLQAFREGVTDMYDTTMFSIRDGLQESTMQQIEENAQGDELAVAFLDQIQEFQGRLDTAISKLQ